MDISSEEYKLLLKLFLHATKEESVKTSKNFDIIINKHPEQFSDDEKKKISNKFICLDNLERGLTEAERVLNEK
jgi:hypothetical protein